MGRIFGTDGVRGVANTSLTAELTLDLSVAAAHVLAEAGIFEAHVGRGGRPRAVVGRDTRISGQFLEAAVVAGLNILVAGGTQAGKTTLLNCLAASIPPRERIVTCEEVFELTIPG